MLRDQAIADRKSGVVRGLGVAGPGIPESDEEQHLRARALRYSPDFAAPAAGAGAAGALGGTDATAAAAAQAQAAAAAQAAGGQ